MLYFVVFSFHISRPVTTADSVRCWLMIYANKNGDSSDMRAYIYVLYAFILSLNHELATRRPRQLERNNCAQTIPCTRFGYVQIINNSKTRYESYIFWLYLDFYNLLKNYYIIIIIDYSLPPLEIVKKCILTSSKCFFFLEYTIFFIIIIYIFKYFLFSEPAEMVLPKEYTCISYNLFKNYQIQIFDYISLNKTLKIAAI